MGVQSTPLPSNTCCTKQEEILLAGFGLTSKQPFDCVMSQPQGQKACSCALWLDGWRVVDEDTVET